MKSIRWSTTILTVMLLTACSIPTAIAPAATPAPDPTATPQAKLTEEQLKNLQVYAPQSGKTVQLVNGKYEAGAGADYLMVQLLPQIAFGDLNGDSQEDAAILIAENSGGSGVFVSVAAVLNQNGSPLQSGAELVDDRPQVETLAVQDGKITLSGVIHGSEDPMCCPAFAVSESYQLYKDKLTLVHFTSKTSSGRELSITIDSPTSGTAVGGSVQVKGSMPIAPFENNLAYKLLDENGQELASGPFAVTAPEPGTPATFDTPVDLSSLSKGQTVWLTLNALSMKDGSPLSMSAVLLTIQ